MRIRRMKIAVIVNVKDLNLIFETLKPTPVTT